MQEIKKIRRFELIIVGLTFILYVTRQLMLDTWHFRSVAKLVLSANGQALSGYNLGLHAFFPVIAGALCLFIAWYTFHFLLAPHLRTGGRGEKIFLYIGLILLFIVASVFLYHYFKRYIHIRESSQGNLIGTQVYSLYRKQTVFSDTVGALILLCIYEMVTSLLYFLHQKLAGEAESKAKYLSYLLLACMGTLLALFAATGSIPTPLWEGQTAGFLLVGGLVVQAYLLHRYLLHHLFPFLGTYRSPVFISNLFVYLLLNGIGALALWVAYGKLQRIELVAVIFLVSLLCSGATAYMRSVFSREKIVLQKKFTSQSAELATLRAQINPHFLFNALNSLYAAAMKEKSEKTAEGIQKLGDMMRFMLEENNQERIPLEKEVEYLHNYIQMQRMRIDEKAGVEIRVTIQEPAQEIFIAPMMLIPFVENAFKHGISLQHASWIYITLTLDATHLYLKVHNSLHPQPVNDPEKARTGVGLENVKKRLELVYPNRHNLHVQQSERDYFISLALQYS